MSITSDDFYVIENGAGGGLVMVPRKRLQAALDRHYERLAIEDRAKPMKVHRGIMTKDAMPPMNNLGRNGTASPDFDDRQRLRFRGKDQTSSPGTSEGDQGRITGSPQRRPPDRADTPPSLRGGQFTTSSIDEEEINIPSEFLPDGRGPSADQEPDESSTGLGQVIATLEDPGPGLVYRLVREDDQDIAVVLCEDDGADLNQNDTTMRHRLTGDAAFMRRLNGIHRRRWSRTRDANTSRITTLFRHRPGKGERLSLEGPNSFGSYDLVLYSPLDPDALGSQPPGSQRFPRESGKEPVLYWNSSAAAGENDIHELEDRVTATTGDRRVLSTGKAPPSLAEMNRQARSFWAGQSGRLPR
jgi:hypothetical protein